MPERGYGQEHGSATPSGWGYGQDPGYGQDQGYAYPGASSRSGGNGHRPTSAGANGTSARASSGRSPSGRNPASKGRAGNGSSGKGPSGKGSGKKAKKKRHRSPLWTKLVITLGVLVLFAVGGVFGGWMYLQHALDTSFKSTDLLGNDVAQGNSIDGPINLLLVGLDTRPDNTIGSRSDTIIIAHIPASHDRVYLVSIPRDTNAYIPADKATGWGGGDLKINAAFQEGSMHKGGEQGGFKLLADTIKRDYGITFNGGGIVNFDGFTDIVNKVGGVRMYVDEKTISIHHGYLTSDPSVKKAPYVLDPNCGCPKYGFDHPIAGVTPVVYTVGWHDFTAYEALDYVRIRDGLTGADYARQRHQQQFLKALLSKMMDKGLTSPTALPGFMQSLGKAVTMDWGGVSLSDWIFTLKSITPNSIITIKTNDGQFVHYTGPAPDARQELNATSMLMLKDVIDDKMDQFIAQYPDWVATS